jgi:hypothetical protein
MRFFINQKLTTSSTLNSASFAPTTAEVLVFGHGGMGVCSLTQRIGVVLQSRFDRLFTKMQRRGLIFNPDQDSTGNAGVGNQGGLTE